SGMSGNVRPGTAHNPAAEGPGGASGRRRPRGTTCRAERDAQPGRGTPLPYQAPEVLARPGPIHPTSRISGEGRGMRAVLVRHPGGPEQMVIGEVPTPEPDAGQLLVRIHATALNRADILQ